MRSAKRSPLLVLAIVVVVVLGLIAGAVLASDGDAGDPVVRTSGWPSRQSVATPTGARPPGCDAWKGQAFAPDHLAAQDVGTRAVQSLPRTRDAAGFVTSAGPTNGNPSVYAWDNESARPGENGSVLLTAHTYRDDRSALGNRLLAELQTGEIIRLISQQESLCYRVVRRVDVRVEDYPVSQVYETTAEQAVVTVCSGFDGGDWTRRTLWFAEPVK